jgi:hypothetical protein
MSKQEPTKPMNQPPAPPNEAQIVEQSMRVLGLGAHLSAALHSLTAMMEAGPASALQERIKLASAYESTAATLRSRAAKLPEGSAERAENEARAARFEARARVKRAGDPMPRELRTPRERLEGVGEVRDGVLELLRRIGEVDGVDFEFFETSLVDDRRLLPPRGGSPGEQVEFIAGLLRGLAARLGALVDEQGAIVLLPFAVPTAESPAGTITSMIAGSPGPQPRVYFTPGPTPAAAPPGGGGATDEVPTAENDHGEPKP